MILLLKSIISAIRQTFSSINGVMSERAVDTIEYEIGELENIFGILVLGVFIGIPAPPIHITMELSPLMNRELEIMLDKVSTAHDPLGDLFSVLEID